MNIRGKLTFKFLAIVSLIFITASITIYKFSADYRRDSYYSRLLRKATITAKLLTEAEEEEEALLKKTEIDNLSSLSNERISIYNYQNRLLFTTSGDSTFKADVVFIGRIRKEGEVRYKQGEFENIGFVFTGEKESFIVVAGAIDIDGIRRLQHLKRNLLIINGMSFILVFVAGWLFSGQALSPIKKVINQVDEIGINKMNLRVDEGNGVDEVAHLAKTFNRMLDRLELAFKIEKNFIANASHEIRTPLTAITGHLEVNLMKERTNEEYKALLQSILEDMKNLISISNRLLLLAQTSTDAGKLHFTPIRIDEILWQVQSELKKWNSNYKVHLQLSDDFIDDKMLMISGNEQLIRTALVNLADNGCKYSPQHEVWIHLKRGESGNIIIGFHDKGIGINEEDLQHIFEPFHRGKNALPFKGHGIGLSLVKRIITLHNGLVSVESSFEKGTTFTVSLLVASASLNPSYS